MQPESSEPLVAVENLTKHFPILRGVLRRQVGSVQAVDGLDFAIHPRETLGLVGESGCGKSTVGRMILRLYTPTAGRVRFRGEDITALQGEALRKLRPHMQMIFQDPQDSLNPRMTVGSIVGEPLREHGVAAGAALAGARRSPAGRRGPRPRLRQPLPARVLRRAAPAHRRRSGARAQPRVRRLRRADRGARRLDPGAGGEPLEGAAGAPGPHLPLHLPRPAHGASRRRPGGGDVSRQDRGAR